MVKKKIQMIWQAGLEDFAARRERAATLRSGVAHEPSRRTHALDRQMEEQVRRAVVAATAPLRQEVEALKREVDGLKAQVSQLKQGK